jgi:hypothetical protein
VKKSELKQLIREVIGEIPAQKLKWKDGVEISLDVSGKPVGMKYLGMLNSGITLPESDDWRRFFVSGNGNSEKFFSPKLKVWYDVDSSG